MGIFDFFSRKKRNKEYPYELEKVFEGYDSTITKPSADFNNPEMRQHFVFDKCEQMIECSHQMDEAKAEYDSVTAYLLDIDKIESLPDAQRGVINDMAERIVTLQKNRQEYQDYSRKLADPKYQGIRLYEEEFPKAIEKLRENEKYQAIVKRDIDCLQGEKNHIKIEIDNLEYSNDGLKKWAIIIPVLFLILLAGAFFLKVKLYWDITTILCGIVALACVGASAVFIYSQKYTGKIKQNKADLNHVIVLLNRMKAKFVTVKNAVDYVYEKYNIHSSYELEYLWQEYDNLKKERAKHSLSTDDLEYYAKALSFELAKYDLYDPGIWASQVEALLNKNEMVEVRHNLNSRRQKLRSRIESNALDAECIRTEILDMVKEYPQYSEEVLDIVKSIDSTKRI